MLANNITLYTLQYLKNSLVPFLVVSDKGKVIGYNDAFRELIGYAQDELEQTLWPDHFIPLPMLKQESALFMMLSQQSKGLRYTTQIQKKGGTLIPVELYWCRINDEFKEATLWCSLFFDLSALKRADELLRKRDDEINAIIQNSPIPQFIIDENHRVIHWNKALELYSRIRAKDIIGTTDQWKAFYKHPRPCLADLLLDGIIDDLPQWYPGKYKASVLLDDAYEAIDFFPDLGEDGKWLYFTAKVISNSQGKIIGAMETLEDITQQKHAEEMLQEAKNQVEVYLDLMCHDINNLNQIGISNLEVLLKTSNLCETSQYFVKRSLEAMKSSSSLITKLEKIQNINNHAINLKEVDLGQTISETCAQYLNNPDLDVTIKFQPTNGKLVFANELLYEIFSNIIGNAIKHSLKPCRLDISVKDIARHGKNYFQVAIEDYGPGINDDLKPRIFLKFQRGNTQSPGKGLGLYLIRSLVDYYQGKVWVEDRIIGDYSQGSKFIVELPAATYPL